MQKLAGCRKRLVFKCLLTGKAPLCKDSCLQTLVCAKVCCVKASLCKSLRYGKPCCVSKLAVCVGKYYVQPV